MSSKAKRAAAVAAIALSLGAIAAPAASAATPSAQLPGVTQTGSIAICVPLGSVVVCL
ncbi:hypothetical protein ACTD5D_23955 [Nocardia takedensis]|uniref:hypothetical protein n=1 Tax=Nocardia takedensis TaxID=259390 RepID=UPI000313E3F3|nr:hypothetical protein [Nocardia takedensis]